MKACSILYYYQENIAKELNQLVEEGTLEPVEHSWASPIVAVIKLDKENVRKQTVNPASKLDRYPIPGIKDLFSKLAGGKSFTKLDFSQAYLQIPLDDSSKVLLVINTPKGLFRYTQMPWHFVSSRDLSKINGECTARVVTCRSLYRRHPDYRRF